MVVTLRVFAICDSISNDGCILLEHHLETVEGSLPSCSASHLPVFFCSAKTTFNLFKSFILLQYIGVFRKFNTSRAENKANSFVFYPEAQFKLSKFNANRGKKKINAFIFYCEPKFKLSKVNTSTPQFHPK